MAPVLPADLGQTAVLPQKMGKGSLARLVIPIQPFKCVFSFGIGWF